MTNDWATWITAAATVATALLTGTGGFAAWLALSRERRKEMPILERSYTFDGEKLKLGMMLRNRLPEVVVLDSIEVLKPQGMTITDEHGPRSSFGGPGAPLRGTRSKVDFGYQVQPLGAARSQISSGDSAYFNFTFWPPESWSGGEVKLALRISSKADTIRNRRVVVTNIVTAPASKQSD